jgi:hypothetical protein
MAAQCTVRLWSGLRASRVVKVGQLRLVATRRGGLGGTRSTWRGQARAGLTGVRLRGQGEAGRCPIATMIRSMTKHGGSGKHPKTLHGSGSSGGVSATMATPRQPRPWRSPEHGPAASGARNSGGQDNARLRHCGLDRRVSWPVAQCGHGLRPAPAVPARMVTVNTEPNDRT